VFVAGEIQNQESKIKNGKRPYRKTPARQAAYLANLKKARRFLKKRGISRPSTATPPT
jgi:hypothetical protein